MEAGKPGFGAWFENKINRKTGTGKSRLSILSFRQEKLLFRQEFGAVRGRPELPNGVLSTLRLAPVGWVSPPGLEHAGEMAGRDEARGLGDFGDVQLGGGAGASQ